MLPKREGLTLMVVSVRPNSLWAHQICLAMCCALAYSVGMAAEAQTAVLEGAVQDATGGVIANAAVTLRDRETNQIRSGLTDRQGAFRFTDVPVGTYEVRVTYDGFTPYVHAGVVLAIGQTARLSVAMQPAGVVERVAVSAQPPPLDSRQTSVATTIGTERIEELPVRSRNYLEFVLLAPGVTRSQPQTAPGVLTLTLPDSGFSFGGLRARSNTLTIDGLDNNDEFTGSSRTELSLEIVREFQVISNGWSAENGGGAGGGINVVTKSGANMIHGDAFLFGQSGVLNARPKLEETLGNKPSLRRYRAGLAIGGPLVKDSTFYYAAVEREHTHDQSAADIDPDTASSINRALGAGLFPGVRTRQLTIGLFPTARAETEWSAKVMRQMEDGGALVSRVAATHNREDHDAFNTGGLSDRSARGDGATQDIAFTGSWNTTLGAGTTNELRGQFATRSLELSPTERDGAEILISGVADFGSAHGGDSTHDQRYIEFGDTVGHSRGSHFLKAGVNVRHVAVPGSTADGVRGIYLFRTLDAFLDRQPEAMRQLSAGANVDLAVTRASAFVQDHWTPQPTITLDAGVRVDASVFPSSFGIRNHKVSPRVGVAWTPAPKWVLRGGAGTFADRLVLAAVERAWLTQHHQVVEQITDALSAAPSIYAVRRGAWNSSSRQTSVGAERQLTSNLTASINYLFVQGCDLPRTVNVNLPPPTILTLENAARLRVDAPVPQQLGRPMFGPERLNSSWDGIYELQPTASSTYHGITMAMNKRLANEIEWSAAYTWSDARDSASDFDEQPQNPYALADEWSDSRYDERHRLVVSALFDLPIGDEEDLAPGATQSPWARAFSHIEVASILTVGSGHPANAITGGDDNRTRAFPFTSRPLTVGRNSWRLPASATFDVRVLKYFNIQPHGKLDLVIEAFNVLNRTNVTQVNTVYGPFLTPLRSFGLATDAGPSRQLQLSVDFEF